jgi:hypothetical protein
LEELVKISEKRGATGTEKKRLSEKGLATPGYLCLNLPRPQVHLHLCTKKI